MATKSSSSKIIASTSTQNNTVFGAAVTEIANTSVSSPIARLQPSTSSSASNRPSVSAPQFASSEIFVTASAIPEPPTSIPPPARPPSSANDSSRLSGLSTMAVAGLSLGLGLLFGFIGATLVYIYRRRRRAAKKARNANSLLDREKHPQTYSLSTPIPPVPPAHRRIIDWVQRTRPGSMTSVPSSYSLITPDDSESIVHRSISSVMRAKSTASSRSAYSQASAARERPSVEEPRSEGGVSRPPQHLYRISEYAESM
ncbi:hypothetical protein R3P38DRAFT_3039848 [Favolaschia claudopus]|uniref:Uncharacterized protein n=1 Tax=Favolaschia claudopus TaxID=2862362 RepID=A0AAW0AAI0_9AGAR